MGPVFEVGVDCHPLRDNPFLKLDKWGGLEMKANKWVAVLAAGSVLAVAGCGGASSAKATLEKTNRVDGSWDNVATFYGYSDNKAACDEIAQILNKHSDEFSGMMRNEFRCQ